MQWYSLYCTVGFIFLLAFFTQCNEQQLDFVPEVVSKPPISILNVKFGKVILNLGDELTPTEVKAEPEISWPDEENAYYTVAMIDPDAPSRQDPKFREFLHWLVVNVRNKDIAHGDTVVQYVGSGPPKGTGLHRYVLLVFKQPGKIEFNESLISKTSRMGRKSFSIQKFAEKYGFDMPAVAGNFYRAQWDEYVPTVHKQLSGE